MFIQQTFLLQACVVVDQPILADAIMKNFALDWISNVLKLSFTFAIDFLVWKTKKTSNINLLWIWIQTIGRAWMSWNRWFRWGAWCWRRWTSSKSNSNWSKSKVSKFALVFKMLTNVTFFNIKKPFQATDSSISLALGTCTLLSSVSIIAFH